MRTELREAYFYLYSPLNAFKRRPETNEATRGLPILIAFPKRQKLKENFFHFAITLPFKSAVIVRIDPQLTSVYASVAVVCLWEILS